MLKKNNNGTGPKMNKSKFQDENCGEYAVCGRIPQPNPIYICHNTFAK